jgi:hypothetical protein
MIMLAGPLYPSVRCVGVRSIHRAIARW